MTRKISSSGWFIHLFPIVFLVGIIGNFLAVIVLRRKAMQTSCSSIYLLVLALADSTVLCLSGFKTWLKLATGFELLHTSDCSCRLILYGFYSATHISAWIIVLVTAERLLVVHWPLKAGLTWLVRRPGLTVSILIFVILVININILYTAELAYYVISPQATQHFLNSSSLQLEINIHSNFSSPYDRKNITLKSLFCSAKRNTLITNINLFIYSLLPSVLLFSFNVAIIRTTKIVASLFSTRINTIHDKLCSSDLKVEQQSGECSKRKISTARINPGLIESPKERHVDNSLPEKCLSSPNQGCCNPGVHKNAIPEFQKHVTVVRQGVMRRRSKECSQQRLTLTLLTLSFCWLFFSFPYSLIDSEVRLFNKETNSRLICYFLMYINHAINFYLYCFLRQKFRNELKRCFASFRVRSRCLCCFSVRKTQNGQCRVNLRRNLSLGQVELIAMDLKHRDQLAKVGNKQIIPERRKINFNDFRINPRESGSPELVDENKLAADLFVTGLETPGMCDQPYEDR